MEARLFRYTIWTVTGIVLLVATLAWLPGITLDSFDAYQAFPLFGLIAFSLMWTHYLAWGGRKLWHLPPESIKRHFNITSGVVLAAILLHPSILIWRLWKDGFGLPPQSYLRHYVAPGLKWVAILGTVSLGVFLAFELHRFFATRSWWHYVVSASDAAMLAIWYHGFALGSNTQLGWFRSVWIFYGITLATILCYKYLSAYGIKRV